MNIEDISIENVRSNRLKSVLNRMLHEKNLDPPFRSGIVNDYIVTPRKIEIVQDASRAYIEMKSEHDELIDMRRARAMGNVAALGDFLVGYEPDEIAQWYDLNRANLDSKQPREQILSIASSIAECYNRKMLQSEPESHDTADSSIEGKFGLGKESPPIVASLEGFESLRNVLIDFIEEGRFSLTNQQHPLGLLLLLEQAEVDATSNMQKELISQTRRKLRAHIDSSPALNRSDEMDDDLQEGKSMLRTLLRSYVPTGSKNKRYPTMDSIVQVALVRHEKLTKTDARQYVESRIAYALHELYSTKR